LVSGVFLGCAGGNDTNPSDGGGLGCAGVPDAGELEPDGAGPQMGQADAGPPPPDMGPLGSCSPIFAQEILPTYRVTISDEEMAKMQDEFLNLEARVAAGLDPHPYHPIEFRWGDGLPVPNVLIRLKGSTSWLAAIHEDADPKMQFVIAFNEIDPEGRFAGLRKIELDMPRNDRSFLRQRLALYYLRGLGLEAQCANSARLEINGAYYGLYAALERIDKEFLQRNYGLDDEGDLWESGVTIKTNETHFDAERYDHFEDATDVETLAGLADLPAALREWAGEALIPDVDGYWAGRPNYYVYDHPTRGYVWIPHDLDAAFDYHEPWALFPLYPFREKSARKHYAIVIADPVWRGKYVEALSAARAAYDVAQLQQRVDQWSAQIADAAASDPKKPFSTADHKAAVTGLRASIDRRADFMDAWLTCRAQGNGPDADGDGAMLCDDCDDANPAFYPGAPEVCNLLDDDCDGVVDDGCQ